MPKTSAEPAVDWTCARCQVTVSWMAEVERPKLPATWIMEDDEIYCLACRRERAGEAALAGHRRSRRRPSSEGRSSPAPGSSSR